MAEVDEQALPPGVTLRDCLPDIDTHMNGFILGGLKAKKTGDDLVDYVYDNLGHATAVDALVETWIKTNLPKASISVPGKVYTPPSKSTKYQSVSTGTLAPIIRCNGIIMGGDKIGHFFQLGYRIYYRQKGVNPLYGRELFERWSINSRKNFMNYDWDEIPHEAGRRLRQYYERQAGNTKPPPFVQSDWNHAKEVGNFGLKASGVYSPADIAANDAGARFYATLAKHKGGGLSVGNFIDKSWSETHNPGRYTSRAGPKVWKNLLLKRDWSIKMPAKAGGDLMSGTCKFAQSGATYTADVIASGRKIGSLNQLKMEIQKDHQNMVCGVIIDGTWSCDGKSGSLSMRSEKENRLRGAWAHGDPIVPDGFCYVTC